VRFSAYRCADRERLLGGDHPHTLAARAKLTYESDVAAGGAAVRRLEVRGRPRPRPPRAPTGDLAGTPAAQGHRLHRRRHPGAYPRRSIAASSKNYRYSTNLQVVIDANSRLVVAIGLPLPGSRNDGRAFTESGVDRACRGAPVIADGGYQGTGLLIPHRKRRGQTRLGPQQEAENSVHRRARARVEHALSRLKNWKILRDCRLKGDGVHQAMLGIARLHNMALSR
jgi:hypothetical protein